MDEWAVDLPGGSPSIVRLARQWVGQVLADFPALVDDMQLIASELVTNCVRHSTAAEGENVHLRIKRRADWLRLEVEDGGARIGPEPGWTGEEAADFGRGLAIVADTADVMGDETTDAGGRLAWAELKI
jgi:anti-sigma regulatory factor (Ser/Thr protein kinase)